ncbi:MAG: Histidine--tRNA ligase [Syntrophus sp. SKADARSKE-3]|nr:Histidine--tRNA ligase [Syntrophus sp. SKADARSKE-3]
MDTITSVKGFKDILPSETGKWRFVEQRVRQVFESFGFQEIRVPIVEKTDLFRRGIGEATDIVEKEMYTFLDRGDEYLTLRPEATASVIRAYLEHTFYASDPIAKLYTIGPMFRRERPQKGRFRQFHQIDVEVLGYDDPRIDAELILMLVHLLKSVGLVEPQLEINSLGCPECRPAFRKAVVDFLADKVESLCPDCKRRMEANPLRIFDCKVESCKTVIAGAPSLIEFLCDGCRSHFNGVQEALTLFGIAFIINPRMVRGLDYYTKTAFEVTTNFLGAQNAIVGGGRYDSLIRDLGGPDIPGIGFAIGFERLLAVMPSTDADYETHPALFIAALGAQAQQVAYGLCNRLRLKGVATEMDYMGKGLKGQMKRANKLNCRYTLLIGDRELEEKQAVLRDMQNGSQQNIGMEGIEEEIINIVKRGNKL